MIVAAYLIRTPDGALPWRTSGPLRDTVGPTLDAVPRTSVFAWILLLVGLGVFLWGVLTA